MDSGGGAGFSAIAPNAEKLPYSARYEGWRLYLRIVGYGCGIVFAALGAAYSIFGDPSGGAFPGAFCLVLLAICAGQLWRLRRPVVIIYPDRIEKPRVLGVSVLHRVHVKGVGKLIHTRNGSYFEIKSSSPTEPDIRLDGFLRDHPIVAEWLRGAPDPQAEALKADRARILADGRYGASAEERERRLKWVKAGVFPFTLVCVALAVWLWFGADLDALALLLGLSPLLVAWGIVATSQGLVVWAKPGSARPQVIFAVAPPLALAARAGFNVQMVEASPLIVASAVIAVAAAVLLYLRLVTGASRLQNAILFGALTGAGAYGLALAVNVSLDHAPARVFAATVIDRTVSSGRSRTYYLDLGEWSDRPRGKVSVPSSLYEAVVVRAPVCVARRQGALGLAWFSVALCPSGDLKKVLNGEPANANQYLNRGNLLLDRREYKAALADFKKAAALDPKSSAAFADIAVAHAWLRNDAAAQANADRALGLDPRQYIAFHAKAIVNTRHGEMAEALTNLNRALAIQPRDLFAWERRMDIDQRLREHDSVLKDSDAIIALGADSLSLRGRRAAAHLGLKDGDWALAEAYAWIEKRPEDPKGYLLRAGVLASLGRKSEADAAIEESLRIKPTAEAYAARARLRDRQDIAGANADLDAALKLSPDAIPIRLMRAELLARAGRRDAAIADFDTVRKASARSAFLLNNLCYSQAAADISLDRALRDCEAALALSPQTPAFLDSKGFVLLRLGRYDDAISSLNAALALSPRMAESLFTRSVAEMRTNQPRKAAADLAAARAISPNIDQQFADYGVRP